MKLAAPLALAILSILPSVAAAQTAPTEFIQVLIVTVKPEAVSEYEDFIKKAVAAGEKLGTAQTVHTFQLAFGGPGFTYQFVFPFNKWGDVDVWMPLAQMLSRGYGEAEGGRILKSGRSATERSESAVFRLLPDLSTRSRAFDPSSSSFVQVVRTEVDPEMFSAYELYLAKLKAAQDQTPGTPTSVRRVSVLGPAHVYMSASFFSKYAERDAWPQIGDVLRKVYGDTEGRSLWENSFGYIKKRETLVWAFRADLSRLPGKAAAR